MRIYRYMALDCEAREFSGTIEAACEASARELLKERGLFATELTLSKEQIQGPQVRREEVDNPGPVLEIHCWNKYGIMALVLLLLLTLFAVAYTIHNPSFLHVCLAGVGVATSCAFAVCVANTRVIADRDKGTLTAYARSIRSEIRVFETGIHEVSSFVLAKNSAPGSGSSFWFYVGLKNGTYFPLLRPDLGRGSVCLNAQKIADFLAVPLAHEWQFYALPRQRGFETARRGHGATCVPLAEGRHD